MAVLARRPFRYAGADLNVDDPVVGLDGETPEGGLFRRLLNSGMIYVRDDTGGDGAAGTPAVHRQAERVSRQKRQAKQADDDGDND
jgi:hypothetical protein